MSQTMPPPVFDPFAPGFVAIDTERASPSTIVSQRQGRAGASLPSTSAKDGTRFNALTARAIARCVAWRMFTRSISSTEASPTPTVTTAPTSGSSDGDSTPWLVVAVVALLAALGLGAAWRTMGSRRTGAEREAADDGVDQRPTP